MSDELQSPIEEVSEVVQTEPSQEIDTTGLSDQEIAATAKGWTSDKEAYETANPGKRWKTAETFLDNEEMIGSIIELKRELREQAKVAKELIAHNHRLAEAQKSARLAELEARQLEAVEVGDVDAFKVAKEAYHQTAQAPAAPLPQISKTPEQIAEITDFTERNKSWCNNSTAENTRMMNAADRVYDLMVIEFPDKPHKEILQLTENKVKELFSHKFENTHRTAPAVTTASGAVPTKSVHGWKYADLNNVQKTVCDALVKSGKTRESYLKQLAEIYGPRK